MKKGNKKHRSNKQKNTPYSIKMHYKARNSVTEIFDDYSSIVFEAKVKATKGTGLRILTPKQIIQRLP